MEHKVQECGLVPASTLFSSFPHGGAWSILALFMGGLALRAVLAGFYAVVLWGSLLLYQSITGGSVLMVVMLGPVLVSGAMVILVFLGFAGELAYSLVKRYLFRGRSTFR